MVGKWISGGVTGFFIIPREAIQFTAQKTNHLHVKSWILSSAALLKVTSSLAIETWNFHR